MTKGLVVSSLLAFATIVAAACVDPKQPMVPDQRDPLLVEAGIVDPASSGSAAPVTTAPPP